MNAAPYSIPLLRQLFEKRAFVLKVCLCGIALSVVVAFLIPKRYEATAMMSPPTGESALTGLMSSVGGAAGQFGMSMLRTPGGYYAKLAGTDAVENRLIDRFDLRKIYGAPLYLKARKKLTSRTAVVEDTKSGVISIRVTDSEAWRAAALANGYVEEVNHSLESLNTSSAHREREFLEDRLRQAKADLDASSAKLAEFSSSTGTLDVKAQGTGLVESGTKLEAELVARQAELKGLEEVYSADNMRVRAAKARLGELERSFQQLENQKAPAGDLPFNMRQLPALGLQYASLYRQNEVDVKVYEELTRQYEMAKIQEVKELPVVQLVDPALVPERHSFPPRALVILLGAFFSFVLSILWVIAVQLWRDAGDDNPRKQAVLAILNSFSSRNDCHAAALSATDLEYQEK
jgi:uncharacterized protein involved in exopolysaccharide biosynthesis